MGLGSVPRELNADAYADAFRLAGENGELVLIQRVPPWEDFLPGNQISAATADTTAAEIDAARDNGLALFFSIDPTDAATGRDRLAALPAGYEGHGFDDPDIRAAFIAYAEYVALNYRPQYLALGVQMNLYFGQADANLDAYIGLYEEAYHGVKAIAPDTSVTLTFQYEDLQGLLPTEDRHFPDWPLLDRFAPFMDVVAISTYPGFVYSRTSDIPQNYYSQLRAFTDKPIVIAETGFSSEPEGTEMAGSEEEQSAFVERILQEAEDLRMPAIIW
jgi:hypothetical protein